MKTVVAQSYRTNDVPEWIARCLESVRDWTARKGYDYQFADDSSFALCGEIYLARVGDNKCSITNLSRLELLRQAHRDGYDRAIWLDADIQVFDPERFDIDLDEGYAVARETWVDWAPGNRWTVRPTVNNSAMVFMRDEPDLDFLIAATRHVGLYRAIAHNFQVGVSLIRGLQVSLNFKLIENSGMFSSSILYAIARGLDLPLEAQARYHGAPVHAANLCGGAHAKPSIGEASIMLAMDRLSATKGDVINRWLTERGPLYASADRAANPFEGPDLGVV
jgi:hypothetical protein